MATIQPIKLRLVEPEWSDRVPSPAHDALTPAERAAHLAANPDSFLAVTRSDEPEISGADLAAQCRNSFNNLTALNDLIDRGAFSQVQESGLYLYQLQIGNISQIALVGGTDLADYARFDIRRHEQTRDHRTRHLADHLETIGAQSNPIALAYKEDSDQLAITLKEATLSQKPTLAFQSLDGLTQKVWTVDTELAANLLTEIAGQPLYVLDGHHRLDAAAAYREVAGTPQSQVVLSALFSSTELETLPFHRFLTLDAGLGADTISYLAEQFPTRLLFDSSDLGLSGLSSSDLDSYCLNTLKPQEIAIYFDHKFVAIDLPFDHNAGSVRSRLSNLDSVRFERHVLKPFLRIDSAAVDDRISYRPEITLETIIASADDVGALVGLMRPASLDLLFATADERLTMPPKSTYFYPKVRSGVFVRHL